jgi:hypothetical protein
MSIVGNGSQKIGGQVFGFDADGGSLATGFERKAFKHF